ncbi:DNA-directed RNA polymerase subunit RPC12/RpoP [Clostridium tetanomorphum]|nr:hypothetical protein CTM_01844 [Clostridium tetanomorphum DSM 665]MBP1864607.1 DNA-directed RNA polymerase subunit RPC12/RpoP [Clostridium tetanomorphum]NRS84076.1 DNA-directed RNA polymerase subunit RPC12/RpoP [Clostridium tetanomorphum]NRZ97290.1 DNA-directed RNA polymerase subunit RPC12/RpoP [Clostridium tetanomorphum]SQB92806.1 Uncharacterised protein [Clostridium tetanomorphum]
MKKISWEMMKIILFLLLTFMLLFFLGIIWWPLFIISLIPFTIGLIIMFKKCRCPYCGTRENMERLLYAKNHIFHCRKCGQIIEIDTER